MALTYGDVRPDHLLKQAQRIRLTVQASQAAEPEASSIKRSITSPGVAASLRAVPSAANVEDRLVLQGL